MSDLRAIAERLAKVALDAYISQTVNLRSKAADALAADCGFRAMVEALQAVPCNCDMRDPCSCSATRARGALLLAVKGTP